MERQLTGYKVDERSQSQEHLGNNPLDGTELDIVRVSREVEVEDVNFLRVARSEPFPKDRDDATYREHIISSRLSVTYSNQLIIQHIIWAKEGGRNISY